MQISQEDLDVVVDTTIIGLMAAETLLRSHSDVWNFQMDRRIKRYHQDEESLWVVELECGHNQHVRHWVNHEKGRKERLGALLA